MTQKFRTSSFIGLNFGNPCYNYPYMTYNDLPTLKKVCLAALQHIALGITGILMSTPDQMGKEVHTGLLSPAF